MSHDPELEARCRKVLADWERRDAQWRPTGPNDPAMLLVELICSQTLELERRLAKPRENYAAEPLATPSKETQLLVLKSQTSVPVALHQDHWLSSPNSLAGARLLESIAVQPIQSSSLEVGSREITEESGCFRDIELSAADASSRDLSFVLPKALDGLSFEIRSRAELLDALILAEYWYLRRGGARHRSDPRRATQPEAGPNH